MFAVTPGPAIYQVSGNLLLLTLTLVTSVGEVLMSLEICEKWHDFP